MRFLLDGRPKVDVSIPAASTKNPATSDCTALLDALSSKGFGPSEGRTGMHPVASCIAPDKCKLSATSHPSGKRGRRWYPLSIRKANDRDLPDAARGRVGSHFHEAAPMYSDHALSPVPTDVPLWSKGLTIEIGRAHVSLFGRGCPRWHLNPGPRGCPRRPDVARPRAKAQASTPRSQVLSAPVVNGWLPLSTSSSTLRRLRRPATCSSVGSCVRGRGRAAGCSPPLTPIFGSFPSPRTSITFAQTLESHEVPKISGGSAHPGKLTFSASFAPH